jgi:hypothetical protein
LRRVEKSCRRKSHAKQTTPVSFSNPLHGRKASSAKDAKAQRVKTKTDLEQQVTKEITICKDHKGHEDRAETETEISRKAAKAQR